MSAALPFPVLPQGNSTHAQGFRLPALSGSPCLGGEGNVAFSLSVQGRHTGILISELNGWPASPRTRAAPGASPLPARGLWPKSMATVVLCETLSFSFPSRFIPALSLTPINVDTRLRRISRSALSSAISLSISAKRRSRVGRYFRAGLSTRFLLAVGVPGSA